MAKAKEGSASAASPAKDSGSKDKPKGAAKRSPFLPETPLHLGLRVALGVAGLLLLLGFFFTWVRVAEVGTTTGVVLDISGLNLLTQTSSTHAKVMDPSQAYLTLLVPLFGLVLTAVGFLGFRWSGIVGLSFGSVVLGYAVVRVVVLFFQWTGVGLWMVLLGGLVACVAGLIGFLRAREDRIRAKGEVVTATPRARAKDAA